MATIQPQSGAKQLSQRGSAGRSDRNTSTAEATTGCSNALVNPRRYCNADWVNLTAQYGFAVPPDTLHFWLFTDPGAIVEK